MLLRDWCRDHWDSREKYETWLNWEMYIEIHIFVQCYNIFLCNILSNKWFVNSYENHVLYSIFEGDSVCYALFNVMFSDAPLPFCFVIYFFPLLFFSIPNVFNYWTLTQTLEILDLVFFSNACSEEDTCNLIIKRKVLKYFSSFIRKHALIVYYVQVVQNFILSVFLHQCCRNTIL